MANKTIGQLNSMTPSSTTELAIYDGSSTGKATVSDLLDTENLVYADDAQTPTSTDVDFESQDTSLTPSSTTSVDLLQGTDSWSQRFVKVSQMFKNIRWILKKIGSTDITSLDSNGTLTGAISTLNNNLNLYNIYIAKEITLTTQTIAGQNAGTWDYDISSQIPNGYNKIFSMYCSAGSYQCFCYTCYPYSNTFIRVQIKNTTNTEITITPRIWCIFSKY